MLGWYMIYMKRENLFQIINLFALLFAQEVRISNKPACIQVVQMVLYALRYIYIDAQSNSFKCKLFYHRSTNSNYFF